VPEPVAVAGGCHADEADATSFSRIQVAEHVDAASHATRSTVDRLVAERVGQTLHGMP
jgi:hypothetical protein